MDYSDSIKVLIFDYGSEYYALKVSEEPLTDYPMFLKFTFRDESWFPFLNFSIETNDKTYNYDPERRSLNYKNDLIFYVDVFVYKHNVNNPLLVGANNGTKYYYYRISEAQGTNNQFELKDPYDYSIVKFFDMLIDEHEKANELFTFRIDQKKEYNGINLKDGNLERFITHTHVPKNETNQYEPVVLNGKNRILEDEILEIVQDKKFEHMTVYFSDKSELSEIPLLVEFSYSGSKYYFHRKNIREKYWSQTEIDESELEQTLEGIETTLFYSVSVSIDQKIIYKKSFMTDVTKSESLGGNNKGEILVKKFQYSVPNYVCYEHDFSKCINQPNTQELFAFGYDLKLLFVNISNTLIENFYEETNSGLLFVEDDPKIYVWFYKGHDNINEDNLPLMIQHYNTSYVPKSRDDYFNKWMISSPSSDDKEIKNIHTGTVSKKLSWVDFMLNKIKDNTIEKELDRVNYMLNAVNLNHKIVNSSVNTEYGIPRPSDLSTSFGTNRIHVTSELFNKLFYKCTHRPKNKFMIREAQYIKKKYYQKCAEQKLQNKGKSRKNDKQKCNLNVNSMEVTVYYFKYDPDNEYPLIVESKLYDDNYDYYVLQCDFAEKAECNFRYLTRAKKIEKNDLCTILTHQNFIIHNVINIKLDKRSPYTCCDWKTHNEYLEIVVNKVRGPKSCMLKGENNNFATKLPFIRVVGYKSNVLYDYIVCEHSLKTSFTNNKGSQGNTLDKIKIIGFQMRNLDIKLHGLELKGHTFVRAPCVFVYFYRQDPRPLMVCYNQKIYVPDGLSKYPTEWNPVENVNKFIFKSIHDVNLFDSTILVKLNETVGFLNKVELHQHPSGTLVEHTYNVHKYFFHTIQINVISENISSSLTSPSNSCYTKLTHKPYGINGKDPKEFRLGNIVYDKNGLTGTVDYSNCTHKWHPLMSVSVYYYNHDKNYQDPLLVELKFKTIILNKVKLVKQYYKLKTCNGNKLEWDQDNKADEAVSGGNVNVAKYLDDLRYKFKKVLKVEIDRQNSYPLMLSRNVGKAEQFQEESGYKVLVESCEKCPNTSYPDYKAFHHKISAINADFDYNSIGGIVFSFSGTDKKRIEILLNDSNTSRFVGNFIYDKCMGDIHVYFSKQSDSSPGIPVFFYFNHKLYIPTSIQDYFKSWTGFEGIKPDFNLDQLSGHEKIKQFLNKVKMLNQPDGSGKYTIELFKSSSEGNEMPLDSYKGDSNVGFKNSYVHVELSDNYKEKLRFDKETIPDEEVKFYINVSEKPPANVLKMPYVDDSELPPSKDTMIPSDHIEMPPNNSIEVPCVNLELPPDDLTFSHNDKEIPSVYLTTPPKNYTPKPRIELEIDSAESKKHYLDIETPSVDLINSYVDIKIPSVKNINEFSDEIEKLPVDLKTFPDNDFEILSSKTINKISNSNKPYVEFDIGPVDIIEIETVKDLTKSSEIETPCVSLEIPSPKSQNFYLDIEVPSNKDINKSSDDVNKPYLDLDLPSVDLKNSFVVIETFSGNYTDKSNVDTETPDDDLEILPAKYPQTPYFYDPELENLDDKLRDTLEKQSCLDEDQSKRVIDFKILDFTRDNIHVELNKSTTEHSDVEKFSKEELFPDPPSGTMPSTGLASTSADSDNSYLGPILGGTFGLLITLGLFTFMLFKYFRRVRLRNMIPQLY